MHTIEFSRPRGAGDRPRNRVRALRIVGVAAALALVGPGAEAAAQVVRGVVTSEGEPLRGATVRVEGLSVGVLTDEGGRYHLSRLRPGQYTLVATAPGHAPGREPVTIGAGTEATVDFDLAVRALTTDPIVVTGTRKEVRLSESPVKVEVIASSYLAKRPTSSLVDALESVNGLYQQVDCGVCYTNSIRINGLEGPYTAVLIDGAPMMGALAAVYGLNGIDPAVIEQVEVIKGPASTLYGPEAMAGVINVITKDPRFAPTLSGHVYGSSDGELNLDFSASPRTDGVQALVSGNLFRLDRFIDRNGDGFSDVPRQERAALFGKVSIPRDGRDVLDVFGRYYVEDRAGGVRAWTDADRGSGEVYGESILTERLELVGRFTPRGDDRLVFDFSGSAHRQDSWYGDTEFMARQQVLHGNAVWNPVATRAHDLLLGAAVRYQGYDDDTPATARAERRWIPGIFAQHEAAVAPRLRALGGIRLDHHAEHGVITSPRLNLKWTPSLATTVRLNAGTGFRVVTLFTEDHAALTGARTVVIAETLAPERSYNVALNLNHTVGDESPLTIDADVFYTRFSNRILPDYDADPNLIVYRNLDGYSVSRGVAASISRAPGEIPLGFSLGGTWLRVFTVRDGVREPQLHAPEFQGVFSVSYDLEGPELTLDYTGRVTGPMALPSYPAPFTRPTRSDWYSVQHLKLTKHIHGMDELDLYLAVDNLFDYRQASPLIDPSNPFGDSFDTAYVYAPMRGRSLIAGVRFGVSK